MNQQQRQLISGAILAPILLLPLLLTPQMAIAAGGAAVLVYLAHRSIVYPVVFVGMVPVLVGVLGSNPLPGGAFTALFFGWTVLAIAFAMRSGDVLPLSALRTAVVVGSIVLAALMLIRVGVSPDPEYGMSKVQLFVAQNLVALFAGIIIGRDRRHLDLFLALTLVVALASALVLMRDLLAGGAQEVLPGRFALAPEENPIFLGRVSAEGLIVAIFFLLAGAAVHYRLLALAALPALGVALLSAGSRGPVLGLLGGILVLLVCLASVGKTRRRIPILVLGAVLTAVLAVQLVPGEAVERSLSLLSGGEADSLTGRTDLWAIAFDEFARQPLLGIGTGGFAAVDPLGFPHNLLVEAAVELGLVGLLLVCAILVSAFGRLLRAWRRAPDTVGLAATAVIALFVATVINAMLSGDITVNNGVWLTAGLAVGLASRAERPDVRSA